MREKIEKIKLASLCRAFSNPERVRLVLCLVREAHVSALLEKCHLSQSALSQHLAVLRLAGIVTTSRKGKHVYYKTASPHYAQLAKLITDISR
jgi:ArsR family transcriptional regulator